MAAGGSGRELEPDLAAGVTSGFWAGSASVVSDRAAFSVFTEMICRIDMQKYYNVINENK